MATKVNKADVLIKCIKPQSFSFICPIYEHLIEVIIGEVELKRVVKLYPKNPALQFVYADCIDDGSDVGGYHYASANCTHSIIYLTLPEGFFEFARNLSHEIRHCVDAILIPRGFDFIPNTANESFSYLQGYLTEVILEKIKYS